MDVDLELIYPWAAGSTGARAAGCKGRLVLCAEAPGAWSGEFTLAILLAQQMRSSGPSTPNSYTLVCARHDRQHFELVLRKQVPCHP